MDLKLLFLLLVLMVQTIFSRPEQTDYEDYVEEPDKCEIYFAGAGLDLGGKWNITIEEKHLYLTYE